VMALAPNPIFATFGLLTSVMIGLALIVSLVVLPSMLVIGTPRRRQSTADDEQHVDGGVENGEKVLVGV